MSGVNRVIYGWSHWHTQPLFYFLHSHSVYNALSLRLHLSVRPKRLIKTEGKNAFPWSKLLLLHLRIEWKV